MERENKLINVSVSLLSKLAEISWDKTFNGLKFIFYVKDDSPGLGKRDLKMHISNSDNF